MRGFDYRCSTGIALLICKLFDSKRSLRQGWNRVGRYDNEKFFKGIHPSLATSEPIDKDQHTQMLANVTRAMQAHGTNISNFHKPQTS